VGNNFPVFFIRDGMKFPDMVHALKPNPKTHIQEGWRIMDFFSHIPESMHMVRRPHLPLGRRDRPRHARRPLRVAGSRRFWHVQLATASEQLSRLYCVRLCWLVS